MAASAISGIKWNYFGGISASVCSLVTGIVLARILGPRPYGQVIIASIIYGFINLFVDGGFGQALIQKANIDSVDIRKTFTCQVGVGVCTTGLVYLFAPWIARQFHDPSAVHVIQAMSMMMAIQSTGLVSAALLRREMKFKIIQYSGLASYLFGYVAIGIPLAIHGAGVWSLVLAYLSQCFLNSVLLYAASRHNVIPIFAFPDRSITSFGVTIVANNLVNWGHSNLDNMAVSRLGPVALGLYGRACNFAYQPVGTVVTGLQSVLFSSVARVQERKRLMHDTTLAIIGIVFPLLGAAYGTFALIPATTILGLYGDKWVGVIPLVVPLALAMPFYGIHCLLGPILCGMGRPDLEFWPQAISLVFAAIAYFVAARFSLLSVAWALLSVMLLRLVVIAVLTFRLLGISWANASFLIAKRAGFSAIFSGIVWSADQLLRMLSMNAGLRLSVLTVFSLFLFSCAAWSAGNIVFGRHAVRFMLTYGAHLPVRFVQQLRLQVGPGISVAADPF
jgi:PST family polysaccharide transporter